MYWRSLKKITTFWKTTSCIEIFTDISEESATYPCQRAGFSRLIEVTEFFKSRQGSSLSTKCSVQLGSCIRKYFCRYFR
jgi:hypothetical protein